MDKSAVKKTIADGRAVLGIELGSTRIKAVLIGEDHAPVASGSFGWENRLESGVWTYALADVWAGVQAAYRDLAENVRAQYGEELEMLAAIGVSAMMHGYLAFDEKDELLVPFRTWRNTMTEPATKVLTERFSFNIPQRWSVAHLYQAILNGEAHVPDVRYLTTLAGYVHWKLTGEKVLGVGDAAGMFPIDSKKCDFDETMLASFDALVADKNYPWKLRNLLPRVLRAGDAAGTITPAGAKLLDPSGRLKPGIPLCPPEGDAGTGMAATNSVRVRTGNVSAGTSVFAMVVLEKPLKDVYTEIDMVTTPSGSPVAMVHCNNCTSDINAWAELLMGFAAARGESCSFPQALETIFSAALRGEPDCGGLLSYNYFSGEPITGVDEGRPLFARLPDSHFTFENFARAQIFSSVATLRIGMDILLQKEKADIDRLTGHGGFFKTPGVGQKLLAAALTTPVTVMETAGEGGPWGMALLAAFAVKKAPDETLEDYLDERVFAGAKGETAQPDAEDAAGFERFLARYRAAFDTERAAIEKFKA